MNKEDLMYDLIKEVRDDVKEVRREMSSLKVKVAGVSVTVTLLVTYISKKLGL